MDSTTYPILCIHQIQNRLKGERLLLVADATGLSYPTIKKLADGVKENYHYDTIDKLSRYFFQRG